MRLITWDLALGHLKRSVAITSPPSPEELDLRLKIDAAEALVLDYVNQRLSDWDLWDATVGAWDATSEIYPPPPSVQLAVLVQLGEMTRFRGDDLVADDPKRDYGLTLHHRAIGYLYRMRDPAIA